MGTGFFVSETGDGSCQIATNVHVIIDDDLAVTWGKDGSLDFSLNTQVSIYTQYKGSLTAKHPAVIEMLDFAHDIAILRIDNVRNAKQVCKVPPIYDGPRYVGDQVVVIGTDSATDWYRGGWGSLKRTLTAGQHRRTLVPGEDPNHIMVEVDLIVRKGDSGGPIFDGQGRVILQTATSDFHESAGGIPVMYLLEDLETIKRKGRSINGSYSYRFHPK